MRILVASLMMSRAIGMLTSFAVYNPDEDLDISLLTSINICLFTIPIALPTIYRPLFFCLVRIVVGSENQPFPFAMPP